MNALKRASWSIGDAANTTTRFVTCTIGEYVIRARLYRQNIYLSTDHLLDSLKVKTRRNSGMGL